VRDEKMNDSNYEGCNVLLLGVSYVDGYSSVDDVVRDVCSGNLSQIDGRDVARCQFDIVIFRNDRTFR